MAVLEKSLLEALRAATMSCHTSAGILTSLRNCKELGVPSEDMILACKLMRSAESSARSATSLILSKIKQGTKNNTAKVDVPVVGGADSSGFGTAVPIPKKKARRKPRAKKKGGGMSVVEGVGSAQPSLASPQGLAALNGALVSVLGGNSSAQGSSLGGPSTPSFFPLGSLVKVLGLRQQAQFNGSLASVVFDSEAAKNDGRIAIQINPSGKRIRVLPTNLERTEDDDEEMFDGGADPLGR